MRPLTEDEYSELRQSIIENGRVLVPIVMDEDGNVIDGHHRLKICQELGFEKYANYDVQIIPGLTETEKLHMAEQLNEARRQLTMEEKRNEIKRRLIQAPEVSDRQIAADIGVDKNTVNSQRKKLERTGEIHQLNTNIGADGKERPRQVQRKPVSIFNPTKQEEKAMQNPEIVERVATGESATVAQAIRATKRQEVIDQLEDISTKEAKEIQGVYDVIVIDPPWPIEKIERNVAPTQTGFAYPTMSIDEITELEIPAADNCHIWLWTTQKYLPTALHLLDMWGFKYICTFVWHKPGGFQAFGLPQYNCEFALYAHKGAPSFTDLKAFNTCFNAPRGQHSEKPEEFYDVVRRVTAGRRLDMFNRRMIDGFDVWGKEAAVNE